MLHLILITLRWLNTVQMVLGAWFAALISSSIFCSLLWSGYCSVVLCDYIRHKIAFMFSNMSFAGYSIALNGLSAHPSACFVLFRMRCYQLGCGRRTRPRKLPRAHFRETTCWPTWRNRPRSIPIKKTWCRSQGKREVGAFSVKII